MSKPYSNGNNFYWLKRAERQLWEKEQEGMIWIWDEEIFPRSHEESVRRRGGDSCATAPHVVRRMLLRLTAASNHFLIAVFCGCQPINAADVKVLPWGVGNSKGYGIQGKGDVEAGSILLPVPSWLPGTGLLSTVLCVQGRGRVSGYSET